MSSLQIVKSRGGEPVAPEALLLTRSKEIGRFLIDDIQIKHQLLGAEGITLQAQRWSSKIIWG